MTLKEKILEASRVLFNAEGVKKVTVRDICNQLKISPGSFSYHFPDKDKKEKIVTTLYKMMLSEMTTFITAIPREEASILYFLESHKQLFIVQKKYKFFYLNLFDILNSHTEVKKMYLQNIHVERQMARQLLQLYGQKGVLKEGIEARQFDRLINVGQMLNNSWAIDAELHHQRTGKEQLIYYMNICCGLLEPYLTPPSLKEYQAYFDQLEAQPMNY